MCPKTRLGPHGTLCVVRGWIGTGGKQYPRCWFIVLHFLVGENLFLYFLEENQVTSART